LRLRLLGPARIEAGDPLEPVDVGAQKGAALAFYLAARADQPVPRSRLIALLWADSDEPEGRNSLSTALSRLRRSLPGVPIAPMGDSLLWRSDAAGQVWTDIGAFAELTRDAAKRRELDQAVDLWRGPFLEGFDLRECSDWDEWLGLERSAWQQRVLDALERAADAHAVEGDWSGGLVHARRALRIDPFQERFHRQVMQLHERAGDRAAALAHYRTASHMLANELGVEPAPATQRLYREVLAASEHEIPTARPRRAENERRPARQQPMFPLVGRQTPLAQLLEAADDAAAGRGRVITVDGEEGIGKSRLVEELVWLIDGRSARDLAVGPRWTVLVGACHASERGLPYHPFVDLLTAAVAGYGSEVKLPDVWLAEVARLVPDLVEQRPDLPTPARLDPQQEARRLFEGAARFFGALPAPTLLVIEDLHWADEGSLRMLDYLAHHEALRSTLLVTTIRTEDVDEHLLGVVRGLERQRLLERIELGPLAVEATVQLLREVVRDDVRLLGEQLHAETEGNPLFAVETIRSLLESGELQLGASTLTGPTPLPESVQAAIRARLARLDPDAYELARAAAVLGGDLDFDQVRGVAGQDEDRALVALERLLASHLLRERNGDVVVGEASYSFSHDKVRQVVYDDLSGARRRVQHRRALEVLGQTDAHTPAEQLAYHALRAQDWDQALRWCEAAAEAAVGVFAYTSAATLYEQALEALARLPDSPVARAHGIRLRLRLARFAFYVAPGRLGEWLQPAERDARELGNATLLAYVNLAQAGALYIQGRFGEALPLLERIRPIAEARPDPILRAQFPRVYGQLQALRGDYASGVPALHQAIERLREQGGIELTVATGMLGASYAYMGEFDRAFELVLSAHARSESVQDQAAVAASEGFLCAVYHMQADWPHAREHGRRAVDTARAAGSVVHEFVGLVYLGLPEAKLGDPDAGASALLRAIAIAQTTGTWVLLGRAHGWMAEIELDRGQPASALELARRGLQMSIEHAYLFDAGLCERIIGESLAAMGDTAAARSHLESAASQFANIQASPELGRTRLALSALG